MSKYDGSCHCGAVRFCVEVELAELVACNCSICSRAGWLLAFVPAASFELLAGEDALTDYLFYKKSTHHPFCKVCGIHAFSHGHAPDGGKMMSINVRCLAGVDATQYPVMAYDGAKL